MTVMSNIHFNDNDYHTHAQLLDRCESYAALHGAWVNQSQDQSSTEEGSDAYESQRLAL